MGNYSGPGKYDALTMIMPRATSIHAKAAYADDGVMQREEFLRCLDLALQARFDGPYVLIYDSPGDERDGLAYMAQVVRPYVERTAQRR
jgi:hypothetical protein